MKIVSGNSTKQWTVQEKNKLLLFMFFLFSNCCSVALSDNLKFGIVGLEKQSIGFRQSQFIADELGVRIGHEITLVPLPAERALYYLSVGKIDGDWSRIDGFGKDIPGLIQVSEPIAVHPYIAYSVRQDISIKGWESLKSYKVAHLAGMVAIANNLAPFHDDLFPMRDIESALNFVRVGRADIFITIPFIMDPLLEAGEAFTKDIRALQPAIDFLNMYIYLLPKHVDLEAVIASELKAMKSDVTYGWGQK